MAQIRNHKISTLMLLSLRHVSQRIECNQFPTMTIHSITTSGQNDSRRIGGFSCLAHSRSIWWEFWIWEFDKNILKNTTFNKCEKTGSVFTGIYGLLVSPVLNCPYVLQIFTKLICIHFGFKNIVHLKNKIWLY